MNENGMQMSYSKKSQPNQFVKLVHSKGYEKVLISQLCEVSQVIREKVADANCLEVIRLENFSESSVEYIAGYVRGKTLKDYITYNMFGELLRLCKFLGLSDLRKKLENNLHESCKTAENVIETLVILSMEAVSEQIQQSIHEIALEKYMELALHPFFHSIPPSQLFTLVSSCFIKVERELVIADSILYWLKGQEFPEDFAIFLFSTLRSRKLNKTEKEIILERIKLLGFPNIVLSQAEWILSSRYVDKVCYETHPSRSFRCGAEILEWTKEVVNLPLSEPKSIVDPKKRLVLLISSCIKCLDQNNSKPSSHKSTATVKK